MRVVWQCCRAGGGGVLAVRTARAERCEACSWRRGPRAARAATRAYSYSMYTVTIIQYYSYESRVSDPGSDLAFSPRGHGFQHSAACVVPSPSPHRNRVVCSRHKTSCNTLRLSTARSIIAMRSLSYHHTHTRVELSHEHSIVHRKVLRPQWRHIGRPIRRATDVEPGSSIEYRAH